MEDFAVAYATNYKAVAERKPEKYTGFKGI